MGIIYLPTQNSVVHVVKLGTSTSKLHIHAGYTYTAQHTSHLLYSIIIICMYACILHNLNCLIMKAPLFPPSLTVTTFPYTVYCTYLIINSDQWSFLMSFNAVRSFLNLVNKSTFLRLEECPKKLSNEEALTIQTTQSHVLF